MCFLGFLTNTVAKDSTIIACRPRMVGHNYNIGLRHLLATDVGNFYGCASTIVVQQSKPTMLGTFSST